MVDRLREPRTRRRREQGFTLIELLVVVVIIGILIAIAIPVYLNYQKGAANKSAQSDTRNAIAAIEQCYTDSNNTYPASATAAVGAPVPVTCGGTARPLNVSPGNKLTYTKAATGSTYTINTSAGAPGDRAYLYDSATGQTAQNPVTT